MAYQPPHIVFDCEVLTPMFLAGADQDSAELRASSVRGMLRYWYRALLGGRGYTGIELAKKEGEVFGTIGYKDKVAPMGGAVEVLTKVAPGVSIRRSKVPNPRRPGAMMPDPSFLKIGSGTGYLWYSAALGDNNRGHFPEKTRFSIALVSPKGNTEALLRAASAMWCLTFLGGMGTRSRNGAGSFKVLKVKPHGVDTVGLPNFTFQGNSPQELKTFLETNLVKAILSVPRSAGAAAAEFDVIAQGKTSIVVAGLDAESPFAAARTFGEMLQGFRTGSRGHDGRKIVRDDMRQELQTLKPLLAGGSLPPNTVLMRPGFGLPYTITHLREQQSGFPGGPIEVNAPKLTRRASPMQVSIVEGNNGYADVVVTTFNSHFLPGNSRDIEVKANRRTHLAQVGRGIIKRFRDEVLAEPDRNGKVWMETVNIP